MRHRLNFVNTVRTAGCTTAPVARPNGSATVQKLDCGSVWNVLCIRIARRKMPLQKVYRYRQYATLNCVGTVSFLGSVCNSVRVLVDVVRLLSTVTTDHAYQQTMTTATATRPKRPQHPPPPPRAPLQLCFQSHRSCGVGNSGPPWKHTHHHPSGRTQWNARGVGREHQRSELVAHMHQCYEYNNSRWGCSLSKMFPRSWTISFH